MEQINLSGRLTKTHLQARLFDEGDHWQKGEAFLPFVSLDAANQATQKAQMENSLETENVIGEVLNNEQNAVFGREPDWQIIPENESGTTFAEEAEQNALSYWNDYNCLIFLKEANRRAGTQEKCFIRAYVPKGLLTGKDKKSNPREAMDLLRFEVLTADNGGVFLDEETHKYYGLLEKTTTDGKKYTELTFVEDGKTFVKIIKESNYSALAAQTLPTLKAYMPSDKGESDETSYELGGELMFYEISRKPLITDSIISNQKDVNLCLTMKNRLTYQAAYRDFFFFNTEPPTDEDGEPASIKTGGKSANFNNGVPVYKTGTDEVIGYASPSMTVIDPADPESIIKSYEASKFAIYSQTSQVHLTKNESANISGVSKRESRFSFEKHGNEINQIVSPAGRWMLKILTLFAADNLGQTEKYKSLRYDFNCRIDAGAPDAEEIAQAVTLVGGGHLSEETLLSKYLRFDDADAEFARLMRSESYQIAMWKKRLETAKEAREMGLPSSEWVKILYPDDEEKQKEIIGALVEVKAEGAAV